MKYRKEIDGLRAVAVVPVILFHAGVSVFSGGYVGVDVFFVISGYLITSILIEDRMAGTYSVLGFYERRARRILPALFVVLLSCLPFAYMWIPPYPLEDFSRSLAFAALFASNVHFLEHGGYFDVSADLRPLLHTWSLAVEEQFYLIFPAILFVLGGFVKRRYLIGLGGLALASLVLAEWAGRAYPAQNFYFTPSRLWELLAGSLCAVILFRRDPVAHQGLAALGLCMIVGAMIGFHEGIPTPSTYTLVPVMGTCLIILYAGPSTYVARLLSVWPVVGIGLISYSAYLWHQPLFAFARIRFPLGLPDWVMLGLALGAFGLAWLTWRFVEQPFRGRAPKLLPSRLGILSVSAVAIAVLATGGLWVKQNDGIPSRMTKDTSPFLACMQIQTTQHEAGDLCPGQGTSLGRPLCMAYEGRENGPKIALLGDSHARTLLPGFEGLSQEHDATVLLGDLAGCPPLLGVYLSRGGREALDCEATMQRLADEIITEGADTVFLIARWSHYASGVYDGPDPKYKLTRTAGARIVSNTEWQTAFETGLGDTIDYFKAKGLRAIVAFQVPQQKAIPGILVENAMILGMHDTQARHLFSQSAVSRADSDALQAHARTMTQAVADERDVSVVNFDAVFVREDRYIWFDGEQSLYLDDDHVSGFGARTLAPMIQEVFLTP